LSSAKGGGHWSSPGKPYRKYADSTLAFMMARMALRSAAIMLLLTIGSGMVSYSNGEGGSGSQIDAIRGASILAPFNMLDAFAARARTSVSAVAEAGVGVSTGMNRGGAVASGDWVLEVLQKKDGEKPPPKMSRTWMQIMCWSTVTNLGAISR
jgi:hypothetical protein